MYVPHVARVVKCPGKTNAALNARLVVEIRDDTGSVNGSIASELGYLNRDVRLCVQDRGISLDAFICIISALIGLGGSSSPSCAKRPWIR